MTTTDNHPVSPACRFPATAARLLAAVTASAFAFSGAALAAECQDPDALTFAMVPTEETVAELELYKPVTDRMAALTGKKIQFFMPTSYASVVEGMLGGFVQVAVLGPYSYVPMAPADYDIIRKLKAAKDARKKSG